jgi:D-sedoheptulose 7-phosphate isomerase
MTDSDGGHRAGGRETVARVFDESIRLHQATAALDPEPVLAAAELILGALGRGGKVLAFGNGGSAADAQHFTAELVGRYRAERRALAAIALSTDTSAVTAIANDYGYEQVFARQIEALGRLGDVALGITTSGTSPNVVAGLEAALARGIATVALTGGTGGRVAALAHAPIVVPGTVTARIQEVHRTLLHAICELIEERIAGSD